jgi:peptide chain release factor 2
MTLGGYFDISTKEEKINALEKEISSPNFWDDNERANKIINELTSIKKTVKEYNDVYLKFKDINDLFNSSDDDETTELVNDSIDELKKKVDDIELYALLSKPYDNSNCILEVHSGAGGTEACDWALMLYRMYTRYCEKKRFKYEVIDYQDGDETGIKSASIRIKGEYAYGLLKCEKGIHRLVRLSPFDANHKRHTSFASVLVTPEIDEDINIEINDKDLKIDVFRSSGNGGQGVNTTDSAVRITHLPTKIVVTCQNERSQLQNKEEAMKILKNKLKILEIEKNEEKMNNIKGEQKNIEFGSQIRSYVLHPYSMIKDHRTNVESSNVDKILDGDIGIYINAYLRRR